MKARWLGKEKLAYWDRNAPLPERPERIVPWADAQAIVLEAYGGFAPEMASIARRFFDGAGSTRRCARASRPAPSRTRPCRRRTPTC